MRFLAYFVVIAVAVGSVLFGLDVLTSPPPQKPVVHVAGTTNKLTRYEAARRTEKTEGDRGRPLTPLYPANPGGEKDVRVVYPPGNQPAGATGAAPAEDNKSVEAAARKIEPRTEPRTEPKIEQKPEGVPPEQVQPPQAAQQTSAAPPPEKSQAVRTDQETKPAAAAAAQALQAQNHCDVAACSRAYSSFRAADCTYQPYQGPRRACTAPPTSRSAEREQSRRYTAHRRDSEKTRAVDERYPAYTAIDRDDAAMDQDDDESVDRVDSGRRVIILDRIDRPWN